MNVNDITFGIEIECLVPTAAMLANGVEVGAYHNGYQVPCFPSGWVAMRDGSISAPYGMTAVEFVSPKLSGMDGLNQVRLVFAKLNEWAAEVNSSTGLHIHVGVERDANLLKNIIRFSAQHEKAIFATTGSKAREANYFTKPISTDYVSLKDMKTVEEIGASTRERYYLLNLQNLVSNRRNTVEFRAFAGTMNVTDVLGYIQVCVGLVEKAYVFKATPAFKRTVAPTSGSGSVARLMTILKWTSKGGHGVIDPTTVNSIKSRFAALAAQYDASL